LVAGKGRIQGILKRLGTFVSGFFFNGDLHGAAV
jgi:hypothetical protein